LGAEEAQALPDGEALDLVFRSGLSTSPLITDVSGHGLGLAIVKEQVERLGGLVQVQSRPGEGTTVRLVLPAAVATFRGLLVRAGGQPFLLPIECVERAIRLDPGQLESVEGREMARWNGAPLPVGRLAALLGLSERGGPGGTGSGRRPCVVARIGEERAGLLVDEVLGDREGLVKELRPPLARVRNVAGAGLLGTGELVLILRPGDLLRSMRGAPPAAPPAPPEEEARQTAVLVVDDSITTRTMERNLLEAAGYRVQVAADGLEGWTALKEGDFDLVVSDVDMPRLDGFELTARIRADQKLAGLPVVLVTALERREDKERGIEVGANAYIIKSSFDQSNLLEIIRRLV
jgi:two-component system chemotaxis sensor kinase CheA